MATPGFNPFDTGQGLSTVFFGNLQNWGGFNPFDTGQGLSTKKAYSEKASESGFNPFDTGQGLSTAEGIIFLTFQ